MRTDPADRLTFVATTQVAALLCGRADLDFRPDAGSGAAAPEGTLVLLATPADDLHAHTASDQVRIAVLTDGADTFDAARFDDYVFPSTSWPEIEFRASCALRRKARGPVHLRLTGLEVRGCIVPLSITEHRLLAQLLEHLGAPVPRNDLERAIGEDAADASSDGGRALDAHVYRLRRKLRAVPGIRIETLRQRGFSLAVDDVPALGGGAASRAASTGVR